MIINLIDTFNKIIQYKDSNPKFDIDTWKKYTHSVSPSLYDKCYSNSSQYDFVNQVEPVICDALYQNFNRIASVHNALAESIPLIREKEY